MSLHLSQASASNRPKRKQGIILHESPVLAINSNQTVHNQCSLFANEAPTYRATFSGTTTEPSISASARRACKFSTFKAGSGTKVFLTDQKNNSSASLSSHSAGDNYRPYFYCTNQTYGAPSYDSSFDSQLINSTEFKPELEHQSCTTKQHQKSLELVEHGMSVTRNFSNSLQPNGQFNAINLTSDAGADAIIVSKQANNLPCTVPSLSTKINLSNSLSVPENPNFHQKLAKFDSNNGKNGKIGSNDGMNGRAKRAQKHQNLKPPFPMAGILSVVVASVCFSTSLLCVKLIPNGESIQERTKQLCFRGFFMMIPATITIIYTNSTFVIKRDEILVNALRTLFGVGAIYGAYLSLLYISIGESQAIIFSAPIWTSILSYFILGEKFSWTLVMGLPICILGIILIAHPDLIVEVREQIVEEIHQHHHEGQYHHLQANGGHFIANHSGSNNWTSAVLNSTRPQLVNYTTMIDGLTEASEDSTMAMEYFQTRLPGILYSILTSILLASVYIVLKFRKKTPIQTTTFHFSYSTVIICLIVSCFIGFGRWPCTITEWILLIINGLFSWIAQLSLQWATAYENASVIAIVRAVDVVMSFFYSVVFLNEDVIWTSLVGAALILGVVAAMMLRNYVAKVCIKDSSSE